MHDVGLRQNLEGLEQVQEVPQCLFLGESALRFDLLLQGASVAVLVYEVVVVGCLEYLDEADDVGGVLYLGEGLDLVDGELLQLGTHLELLNLDDLHGHRLPRLLVDCPVDLPELALPHDVLQHVVLDLLPHVYVK